MRTTLACCLAIIVAVSCARKQGSDLHFSDCANIATRHYDAGTDSILIPSQYDTDEFKSRLVRLLMAGSGKRKSERYYLTDVDFEYKKYPLLEASIVFEDDSDFVVLAYDPCGRLADGTRHWMSSASPKGLFYAGYVKSSDKLYLLMDGFGPSVEEVFTRIRAENEGTPHLSHICKAALMVRMKYWHGAMAIVRSYDDLDAWANQLAIYIHFPLDWVWNTRNSLFTFFPADDTSYTRGFEEYKSEGFRTYSFIPKDWVSLEPPSVIHESDSTIVTMFVHVLGVFPELQEVAKWEVVFDKADSVTAMRYLPTRVWCSGLRPYYHRLDSGSPYYLGRSGSDN